jgi:hypothetical protein
MQGLYWFATTADHVLYESRREMRALMMLNFDSDDRIRWSHRTCHPSHHGWNIKFLVGVQPVSLTDMLVGYSKSFSIHLHGYYLNLPGCRFLKEGLLGIRACGIREEPVSICKADTGCSIIREAWSRYRWEGLPSQRP